MSKAKKATAKKTATKKTATKKTTATPAAAKKTAAKNVAKQTTTATPAEKKPPKPTTAKKDPAAKQPSRAPVSDLAAVHQMRDELRAYAFGLPGAWEDHPWGESVAKVGKKVFVFFGMSTDDYLREGIGMSVKLPYSGDVVLSLPFAEPTGYGLGKSGWVSVRIPPADLPPLAMLTAWIDESFRAVAPKAQVAALDARQRS